MRRGTGLCLYPRWRLAQRPLARFRDPGAYGTCETPEFQRQNREFAAAVETAGKKVRLLVGDRGDLPGRPKPAALIVSR
jgi:hypothetical protein